MKDAQIYLHALLLASALAFSGCEPKGLKHIELPESPILVSSMSWGLVGSAYAGLKSHPTRDGIDLARLRKGEVAEIFGKAYGQDPKKDGQELWYKVRYGGAEGWIPSESLVLFDSREKAEIGSRDLK